MQPHDGKTDWSLHVPPEAGPRNPTVSRFLQLNNKKKKKKEPSRRQATLLHMRQTCLRLKQEKEQYAHVRGNLSVEPDLRKLSLRPHGRFAGAPCPARDQQAPQLLKPPETALEFKMAALQQLQQQQQQQDTIDAIPDEIKSECRNSVLSLFPDLDPDHLTQVCEEGLWQSVDIIEKILDDQEDGNHYPKAPKSTLKRKRSDQEDPNSPKCTAKKWDSLERRQERKDVLYFRTSQYLLQKFFPQLYIDDVRRTFDRNGKLLYPTFLALHKADKEGDNRLTTLRKKMRYPKYISLDAFNLIIDDRIQRAHGPGELEALEEFRAALSVQVREQNEADAVKRKEQQELDNFEMAKAGGNTVDCGCCFTECATNRMVHCDGDVLHWFCRECARMMAETQIGLSKHNLDCMSTYGCSGGFSAQQRDIFLDTGTRTALDRIEAEAALREAGIEDLEACPFCPFAMEYPSLEEDREFRCLNPDCKMVSCRACRKETHIPKTCAEAALEAGQSARHTIEEAMSAALIRNCNKCSTPFIKEHGCNKMTCTKCNNIQCYICSKSCEYSHFNDLHRGGKDGNCPLFDDCSVEIRHAEEVKNAEAEARKKVLEENLGIQADFLEIKTSEKVKEDDERRKKSGVERRRHVLFPQNQHHFARGPGFQIPAQGEDPNLYLQAMQLMLEHDRQQYQRMGVQPVPPAGVGGQVLPPGYGAAPPLIPAQLAARPPDPPRPRVVHPVGLGDPLIFGGFGLGLNQAVAQVPPGIRQSMPPRDLPAGPPLENANQNPHRAGRAAEEIGPLNPVDLAFFEDLEGFPNMRPDPAHLDFPEMRLDFGEFLPMPPLQQDYIAPGPSTNLPRYPQPLPKNPVLLDQPGRHAHYPIDLSSPRSVIDLTGEEEVNGGNRQGGAGRRAYDMPNPFLDLGANNGFPEDDLFQL